MADNRTGKKLKRRLEDLERRAGSSSASPPQVHAQIQKPKASIQAQNYKRSPEIVHRQPSPRLLPSQFTPPMDDNEMLFSQGFERDGSQTPPLFAYQSYPPPDDMIYPAYPQSHSYRPVVASGPEYGAYLHAIPVTLPSMLHSQDAIKREGEDTMSPYNMYTQPLRSMDIHPLPYDDSSANVSFFLQSNNNLEIVPNECLKTPPLTHSYEHSTNGSDSGYHYPATPLSMPPSPPHISHI